MNTNTTTKVTVIGLFCEGSEVSDGQSIKTRIVTEELEAIWGAEQVLRIDTYGWKKHPFRLLANCVKAVRHSKNVIFMTDEGGIKVFPWLLRLANVGKKCRLHYVVIGGWLPAFLQSHSFILSALKGYTGIYVECDGMKQKLNALELSNVVIMRNCKYLEHIEPYDLVYLDQPPYRLCTFSRVMKEKGIEDAVNAVIAANESAGKRLFTLDIYGQVDHEQQVWFDELQEKFPPYIHYCGVVHYEQSVSTLKDYAALLFPTYYKSEGLAGTIIDALAAGVPIIATDWNCNAEFITPSRNGLLIPAHDQEAFVKTLLSISEDMEKFNQMRKNCLEDSRQYMPSVAMQVLLDKLVTE